MNEKSIKIIGLTAEELFNMSLAKYADIDGELTLEAFDEYSKDPKSLEAARVIAREEAILRTVALMIERNNQVLLQHLKQLGVVQDL